jgi:hypothetical protein
MGSADRLTPDAVLRRDRKTPGSCIRIPRMPGYQVKLKAAQDESHS